MIGGYVDEARAFRDWLLRATAGAPAELQIMYGIDGFRRLTEFDLALAARLRGLEAGARRQRRVGPVPARRLRRGAVGPLRGAEHGAGRSTRRAGGSLKERDRVPGEGVAAARRRHLGGARRTAPLHPLEDHGLGRHRSGRAGRSRSSASAATRGRRCCPTSRPCASGSTTRSASAASTRAWARSRSRTAAWSSTPACW